MTENYVVIKNNTVVAGPGPFKAEYKEYVKKNGGNVKRQIDVKPPVNTRMQMYGEPVRDLNADPVTYAYPVLDIPTVTVRDNLRKDAQIEAEHRIIKLWVPEDKEQTLVNALMYQQNQERSDRAAGTTDERFVQTDAIRTASNDLESVIKAADRDALAALDVAGWDGWPGNKAEAEAVADETETETATTE